MNPRTQARNEVEPTRKFKGVWICAELFDHPGLSYADKFLIAEIDSLTDKDKACWASNEFLAKRLKVAPKHMNNMLARLTADGFLHRLAFDGRSTLRCVSPEISSNPSASRQLIKKYSIHKNVKAEFTRELSLPSQKCEAEISNRETQKRNDDDDQLKLHARLPSKQPVVAVASAWPDDDDEPTEIVEADSPSESGKTTFGKAEKPLSGNPEKHFGQSGKSSFGNIEQENTTENTHKRNDDDQLKLRAQLPVDQPVVVVASSWPDDDDEPAEIVEKLTEKLKLSHDQSKQLELYLAQDGKGFVLEKVRLTRSKDLRNAGGFFIRALEKDYREPVTNAKPSPPPKKKRVEPKPEQPAATDEERAQTSAKLKEFIETLRACR